MEITGIIKQIGYTQEVSQNFRKRDLIIETQEQYPQTLMIEFVQDKCETLNQFHSGQLVKIDINLRGREWQNPHGEIKHFTSINGWKIELLG